MKKIINLFPLIMLFLNLLSITSCANKNLIQAVNQPFITSPKIKVELSEINNGDLIFVGTTNKDLSGAINRVTQNSSTKNFDHVGVIEKIQDSIFVLHAVPKGGSQREEIHQFYKNQKIESNSLIIYRLHPEYQHAIASAIEQAKSLIGKPYNWSYILNENEFYCSDFIERAFRKHAIFKLIPMNFKNPNTNEIDTFWVDFYKKQNLEVPQNQPGTNPNQLAESDKLIEIGPLYIEAK